MKRYISIVLALALLFACGCGAKPASPTVSMYDLRVAMEEADDSLPSMLNASSAEENAKENFSHISEMDYGKVESFFVSYSEEGKADEIAVIAVKDSADTKEAVESLKEHRTKRYKLLEQYEPEETKRIEDGLVFSSGQYAVLIICDNSSAVKRAFQQAIGGEQTH
ncbi:MAG: DUF4358 domain-containing protein [Muribaculaceae bacterium]|nr:DUF4358 domain-containing protein [Roseburia sp.]MCM1430754.1 DUF4358 domain-containing protein [Muribaculaceae bacterium]MCM1492733.1 DUF4358 domain-containing protein [Muribaculaceae bacterium]